MNGKKAKKVEIQKKPVEELGYKVETEDNIKNRKAEWEKGKTVEIQKKPVEELGYKVETDDDIRKRKEEWEKGQVIRSPGVQKKTGSELGYKVDDASAEDIKRRKDEWEKGKSSEIHKKPTSELGYKVDDAEDIRKRKDEWEKGKTVPSTGSSASKGNNPEEGGYKVETEGVKNRLEKWNSLSSSKPNTPDRKQPIKIPTENATKDEQTDVKTVKYDE